MKLDYKGKSAVITDASGGMGLEISKKLSQDNISVLMLDLKNPGKEFLNRYKNCEFKKVNVTNFKNLRLNIEAFYKKQRSISHKSRIKLTTSACSYSNAFLTGLNK